MIIYPKKLYIEKGVAELHVTQDICNRLPDVPVEFIDDYRNISVTGKTVNDVYGRSKECLAIARKNGALVKEFRCMEGLVGKNEYFIVHGNNCFFDCKYCFLQDYLGNAIPTLFVNHDDILDSIRDVIVGSNDRKVLFHAGELCDSFLYDNLTKFSIKLVNLFAGFPSATLELRTKTVSIDNVLSLEARGNVVVSWTFSPSDIIARYEQKTPSLDERICAAEKVQMAGYNVGICLDPIIRYEGWRDGYKELINSLFDRLDADKLSYISLGGFRFLPSLSRLVRKRCDGVSLITDEFVPCVDGKYRYFRAKRIEIYKEIGRFVRERSNLVRMYLCMETPEVWNDVTSEVCFSRPV